MFSAGHELVAIVWEPVASPLKIFAAAAILAGLSLFAYARVYSQATRAALGLLLMRLTVVAAVAALMMGPSREIHQSPLNEKPRISILVDTSESMLTVDCGNDSRIQCVADAILTPARLRALQEQFDIDVRGFDAELHPLSITQLRQSARSVATGRSTLLGDSVAAAISRASTVRKGDALLVISDGRDTEDAPVQPAAALAASRDLPVYTLGVGGTQSTVDAALLAIPLQETLLPREPGGILARIHHSGLDGQTAVVRLMSGDDVQRIEIPLIGREAAEVRLTIELEEPGQHEFEVALEPLEGESELSNNSQAVFVDVARRRIRVLLLEGEPFWDSKFLAQSLRKDEQVELTQITQMGAARQETIVTRSDSSAPRVPSSLEEWSNYEVVILGRGMERLMDEPAAAALVKHVSEGGGHVVLARGRPCSADTPSGRRLAAILGVLEPVVWGTHVREELKLSVTASGRAGSWFAAAKIGVDPDSAFAQLPGFERMGVIDREKTGAMTLVRAVGGVGPASDEVPAIASMPYGRGQTVAILGEGLWRWSLLPPELTHLRGFYDSFWSNLVRWLALGGDFQPGQQVSLQLSRTSVRLGDELTIDLAYRQPPPAGSEPRLELTTPDGESSTIALHPLPGQTPRYRASVAPAGQGVHQLVARTPGMDPAQLQRKFNAYEVNLERLQTSANFAALLTLAEQSGGEMFGITSVDGLLDQLDRRRRASLSPPRREYVWDRALIMTLLLAWVGAEWLLRRVAGLW